MISLWENGERNPSRYKVEELAKVLGVSTEYLTGTECKRDSKYTTAIISINEIEDIEAINKIMSFLEAKKSILMELEQLEQEE